MSNTEATGSATPSLVGGFLQRLKYRDVVYLNFAPFQEFQASINFQSVKFWPSSLSRLNCQLLPALASSQDST